MNKIVKIIDPDPQFPIRYPDPYSGFVIRICIIWIWSGIKIVLVILKMDQELSYFARKKFTQPNQEEISILHYVHA